MTAALSDNVPLFQLIYSSAAIRVFDDLAIKKLVGVSARSNALENITGILISHNGMILQVLEGPETAVRRLYKKIKDDPRHSGVIVLIERYTQNREFPNWSMGYKNTSTMEDDTILFELTLNALQNALPASPSPELNALTETFAKVSQL